MPIASANLYHQYVGKMYYLVHLSYLHISMMIDTQVLNRGGKGVRSSLDC